MNRYKQRDAVLKAMGFDSYSAYLRSPLWKRIRARLFKVCSMCVCGAPATQFHHRTYKRRYMEGRGKIHKYMVPICRKCHQTIEFEGSEKLSLGWANSKLDAIRADAESRGIRVPAKARLKSKTIRISTVGLHRGHDCPSVAVDTPARPDVR